MKYTEPVHFRAKDAMLARIATETPQRGTSEELECRAGKEVQSERDVYAPINSYAATTKVHFGR